MKKSLSILATCVVAILLFQAFTISPQPGYKNLQVLPKDISHHDLDSVMHFFTASLGVKCDFCHVKREGERWPDFASDDKMEKKVARKMMLMSIAINKNYFRMMGHHHDMDQDHDMGIHKEGDTGHDMNMKKDMDHDHDMAMNNDMDHDHDMNKGMDQATDSTSDVQFMLRTVTCYTCHRGDPHPEKKPPMGAHMMQGPPPPPPPPAPDNH